MTEVAINSGKLYRMLKPFLPQLREGCPRIWMGGSFFYKTKHVNSLKKQVSRTGGADGPEENGVQSRTLD